MRDRSLPTSRSTAVDPLRPTLAIPISNGLAEITESVCEQ